MNIKIAGFIKNNLARLVILSIFLIAFALVLAFLFSPSWRRKIYLSHEIILKTAISAESLQTEERNYIIVDSTSTTDYGWKLAAWSEEQGSDFIVKLSGDAPFYIDGFDDYRVKSDFQFTSFVCYYEGYSDYYDEDLGQVREYFVTDWTVFERVNRGALTGLRDSALPDVLTTGDFEKCISSDTNSRQIK